MRQGLAVIRSGVFGEPDLVRDYRAELLGDALVERIVWGELPTPRVQAVTVIADTGYIWFRFWLPRYEQVVECYYAADGAPVGIQIDLCMALACDKADCRAIDLILDIWIDPGGRVTVRNEAAFEQAVRSGIVGAAEAIHAESHLRQLTAAIARGKFPPPLVRNWQIDLSRIWPDGDHHAA